MTEILRDLRELRGASFVATTIDGIDNAIGTADWNPLRRLGDAAGMNATLISRAVRRCATFLVLMTALAPIPGWAQSQAQPSGQAVPATTDDSTFELGEIVHVLGKDPGSPGIAASVVSRDQLLTFERTSLDRAVNLVPGVVSTFDSNGRRNESDIFVRGFGRQQVPLMVDGVRIYLPADNRLDFGRFLTADVAEIQIQKGYASVLDGPGAMGGAINVVTIEPTKPFEAEGGLSTGGRGVEGWNAFATVGSRQLRYYVQGSIALSDRDSWSLSSKYQPTANSLQNSGERLSSDTGDWRANVKFGYTPNATNEYTFNYTKQSGEKGAPLNVYNNPPVPPNSFWRWPWWDVQNISLLTTTQLTAATYLKAKAYYNTFSNGLDAFDDGAYTTQSAPGRFHSPYNDHAYGTSIELGTTPVARNTIKAAVHYRSDVHTEQQTSRPTHPTLSSTEPEQEQSQYTWSVALEDTLRVTPDVDVVGGLSYDNYQITKAEEFTPAAGLFENPKGGADAVNWQAAVLWRHASSGEWHASISDRARFPVIFELYSTRFGTATPNPNLGPERATNVEVGWRRLVAGRARLEAAVFYSDVRDLIQTVVLPNSTTQTQNVGNGNFSGVELSVDAPVGTAVRAGGNYTFMYREITDALQPNLRPTGVPTNRAFLYATWQLLPPLRITPSLELADDRWSDVNPVPAPPAIPYVKAGAYALLDLDATYGFGRGSASSGSRAIELILGFKNLLDDHYELAWGYPQPGRTFYVKTRVIF
jgi:iron complex outermembrane receptor protein